jgi:hypothetical protein
MCGPPLVVRQKASMPSKVILGQRSNAPRLKMWSAFENEAGGYFWGGQAPLTFIIR